MTSRLDRCFSWFVRLRDADSKGMVTCITCGKREHWTTCDAGHFISRKYVAARWMGINVHAQCKGCNMQSGGQQWLYSKALERMYGKGVYDEIYEIATTGKRPTNDRLKDWIEYYEAKVAAILAERIAADSSFNRRIPENLARRIHVDRSGRRGARGRNRHERDAK